MTTINNDQMPDAMHHYLRMWAEKDLDLIRDHLDLAVSEDCIWVDPQHNHVGRDALEANVKGFRTRFPNATLGLGSNVDGHNQRYRYEWVIKNGDHLMMRGFDVVTLNNDGLIERVDGFFGILTRID